MIYGSDKDGIDTTIKLYQHFVNVNIHLFNTLYYTYKFEFSDIFIINLFDHPIATCDKNNCTYSTMVDLARVGLQKILLHNSAEVFSSTTTAKFTDKMMPYFDHWVFANKLKIF